MADDPLKIVLTGGPGAGKSVISRTLAERFPDRLVAIPEAATATYARLGTRWDQLALDGRRRVQRPVLRKARERPGRLPIAPSRAAPECARNAASGTGSRRDGRFRTGWQVSQDPCSSLAYSSRAGRLDEPVIVSNE